MSRESLTHPEWYRIADARPSLRPDIVVSHHLYRGQSWYVLAGKAGGRVHRLTPAAYAFAGRLDGSHTVEDLWRSLVDELGEDAPTQGEIVDLLTRLHSSDILLPESRPMLDEFLERRDKEGSQKWKKLFFNPLSATVPLFDPNSMLKALNRVTSLIPSPVGWLVFVGLIASTLPFLPAAWPALTERGVQGLLDLENLFAIGLIYPVVKAIHELGHGLTIRRRGGEVHEMGLMFIAFFPIPYVDASASLAFPKARSRAAVAAAGVVVEVAIAAIAFHVWRLVEPGLVRSLAFNTMLIAGFSTVVVNGNPLMRFDGYHVLCDLIGIPDFGKRANEWWGEIVRIHLLGTREPGRRPTDAWERTWFFFYAPAAFLYRIFISLTIALFVATHYRFLGILLAIWSVLLSLVWPLVKTIQKAMTDERIRGVGPRAGRVSLLLAVLAAGLIFLVPLPDRLIVEGVVWLPREAFVRSTEGGRIEEVLAGPGQMVEAGMPLMRLDAPRRRIALERAEARLRKAKASLDASRFNDRAAAERLRADFAEAANQLADARKRVEALTIRAAIDGRLDAEGRQDLVGQYVTAGATRRAHPAGSRPCHSRRSAPGGRRARSDGIARHFHPLCRQSGSPAGRATGGNRSGRHPFPALRGPLAAGRRPHRDAGRRQSNCARSTASSSSTLPSPPLTRLTRPTACGRTFASICRRLHWPARSAGRSVSSSCRPSMSDASLPWRSDHVGDTLAPERRRKMPKRSDEIVRSWLFELRPPSSPLRLRDRIEMRLIVLQSWRYRRLDDDSLVALAHRQRSALLHRGLRGKPLRIVAAATREMTFRRLGLRHHPVQICGGLALLRGRIVEMATGEGKTITTLFAAIAAALSGRPVHVVTVNGYLAARDAENFAAGGRGVRPFLRLRHRRDAA